MRKIKVAIVSGPTGGHFFPALSIGDKLRENGIYVKFFIPERKFLIEWLKRKNHSFSIIPSVKFSRKEILFPFKFAHIVLKCMLFIKRENYSALLGTGSYTTFPFLVAGKILNKRIYLHEQNYIPGKVTKILSFFSDRVFLTFPHKNKLPGRKILFCGFPLIDDFKRRVEREKILRKISLKENRRNIVVFGGSQSASFLNKLIIENIDYFKHGGFQIIIIAGKEKEKMENIFSREGVNGKVFDFYFDMNELYSIADVIISRAGAGTVAELTYWKIPGILVPYPFAGGHQFFNAKFLERKGGCFLFLQKEENVKKFPLFFEKFMKNYDSIKKALEKIDLSDNGKIVDFILGDLNEKR